MPASPSDDRWSGDMLDQPHKMKAFTQQLRRVLSDQAAWVHQIRRDAEAMWKANPPDGYSSFEAWWRHSRVTSPFAEIEQHLEKAAAATFRLEARYEKHRHKIPDKRQAAAEAREEQAALPRAGVPPERPVRQRQPPAAKQADDDFWGSIKHGRSA